MEHLDPSTGPADPHGSPVGRRNWMVPAAGAAVVAFAAIAATIAFAGNANAGESSGAVSAATSAPARSVARAATAERDTTAERAAAAERAAVATSAPGKAAAGLATGQENREDQSPLGSVITTGLTGSHGELVFWFSKVDLSQLPKTTFGLIAGTRDAGGALRPGVATNETEGSDDAPGFHAVQGAMTIDRQLFPAFGYYSGPVARIMATVNGSTVTLHQAAWDRNPNIVVFWTDLGVGDPSNLTAYDAAGNVLPAGNSAVGHG